MESRRWKPSLRLPGPAVSHYGKLRLVECVRGAQQIVDDVRLVRDLLVGHHAEDSHLRGAAVVELDRLQVEAIGEVNKCQTRLFLRVGTDDAPEQVLW